MQATNNPADIVTDKEIEYLRDANERQTRQFAAIIAERNGRHGVSLVCSILDVSRNTVYRGLHELDRGEHFNEGRVRRKGGGRKSTLSKHPEYITIFREIVEFDIAGLPQDANTKWLRLTPSEIQQIFSEEYHIKISLYTVRQIIKAENFTRRKPLKSLPMADCKLRDEQFKIIEEQRRSWQFKWCLIQLAKRLGINIRIAHYPPYCSMWNPIEHRLFSQISRVWSGAVFNTIEEASELASRARTKTGLAVFTSINRRIYETKTERNPLFESECDRHIVKDEILPKWNYLVRCN